ncbi:chaplin [Streptomyces sp. LE64]|uniref:chaplin n=1 Tax=unclassified Streptomyces TaxID=2593676 RepID=UPI0033181E49
MKLKKTAAVVAGLLLALGAASPAVADSTANGAAIGSPGVLSGNVVQVPINIPVNICGNSVNILALLNPTAGNVCVNA